MFQSSLAAVPGRVGEESSKYARFNLKTPSAPTLLALQEKRWMGWFSKNSSRWKV